MSAKEELTRLTQKNIEFSYKCEFNSGQKLVKWSDIEFSTGEHMLMEEIEETKKGLDENNKIEILDGAGDVMVIALNLIYKMSNLDKREVKPTLEGVPKLSRFLLGLPWLEGFSTKDLFARLVDSFDVLQQSVVLVNVDAQPSSSIPYNASIVARYAFALLVKEVKGDNEEEKIKNALGVFEEITSSNLSKIQPDGTVLYDEVGKVMKPSNYFKPDLKSFVEF